MKYTSASLDLAIETILPYVKKAKDADAPIQRYRPELLKDVAVEYFTTTIPFSQDKMLCLSVAREAMKELATKGKINFGDKDLSEELNQYYQRMANMTRPDALN